MFYEANQQFVSFNPEFFSYQNYGPTQFPVVLNQNMAIYPHFQGT